MIEALREAACVEVEGFLDELLNVVERSAMNHIRGIVQVFCQLVVKFSRSQKATTRILQLQGSSPDRDGK